MTVQENKKISFYILATVDNIDYRVYIAHVDLKNSSKYFK